MTENDRIGIMAAVLLASGPAWDVENAVRSAFAILDRIPQERYERKLAEDYEAMKRLAALPFQYGDRVLHKDFGEGKITSVDTHGGVGKPAYYLTNKRGTFGCRAEELTKVEG